MSGIEDRLGREGWTPSDDGDDGLFPRSVRYMWERMTMRPEQFYVKASFLEIYNEQLRDLLNPSSGILHQRWNVRNGFFVEDLMVVECTSQQDLTAVLHEGMKNRKSGSHELNKDSSRSHSILTVYLISETSSPEDGHIFKKYGKISFVDLAGSERLKESKSQGDMIKETGQINKSLFTLGKVISMLSSTDKTKSGGGGAAAANKLEQQKYIPYRDSKLTMLLMDSLGGASKALMIACISPSSQWAEETISTLNYATRTMNIKNKPIIQMDAKEQIIYNLKREIHLYKLENEYLKDQIYRLNGGKAIQMPSTQQLEQ
jgi:kinesin family member 12